MWAAPSGSSPEFFLKRHGGKKFILHFACLAALLTAADSISDNRTSISKLLLWTRDQRLSGSLSGGFWAPDWECRGSLPALGRGTYCGTTPYLTGEAAASRKEQLPISQLLGMI